MEKAILIKKDEDRFVFKCPYCRCQFHHIQDVHAPNGCLFYLKCASCKKKSEFNHDDAIFSPFTDIEKVEKVMKKAFVLSEDENKYVTECAYCKTTIYCRDKKKVLIDHNKNLAYSVECPKCYEVFNLHSKTPFTEQEKKIWDHLSEAWNLFCKLPKTHPSHDSDFCNGIHQSQRVLEHKLLQRLYPETFFSYEVKNHVSS